MQPYPLSKICNTIFQKWGGGSKAVWNISKKSSNVVAGSFPALCCWRGWGGSLGIRGWLVDCLTTRCQIYLVNPYVQTVHMYGKGAEGVLKAELRAAEVDPHLKKKQIQIRSQFSKYHFRKELALAHNIWEADDSFWNGYFENYGRISFLTPHNFANWLHLVALTRLQATKTRSKLPRSQFAPLCILGFSPFMALPISLFVSE